jgi:hypothetical protein
MNTNTIIGFLLPILSSGLCAQELELRVAATPQAVLSTTTGAEKGTLVLLVLGTAPGTVKLPGGHILGIEDGYIAGMAKASPDAPAVIGMGFAKGAVPEGMIFFAQSVSIDLTRPLDDPKALATSEVQKVQVADRW